jgi:hypothetical protein
MKSTIVINESTRLALLSMAVLAGLACSTTLRADTISVSGTINQSVQDGTGPALANPDLDNILDGDSFTADLSFDGCRSPKHGREISAAHAPVLL